MLIGQISLASSPLLRRPLLCPSDLLRHLRICLWRSCQRLVSDLLLNLLVVATLPELVDSCVVYLVRITLIQVDEKDEIVPKSS